MSRRARSDGRASFSFDFDLGDTDAMIRTDRPLLVALAFAVAAAAGLPASARAQDTIRTADYDVRELEYPPLPDFRAPQPERMELENGMLVFLLEDHELPQVNAVARIASGSVFEPPEEAGLASVTGTVMRTGGTESMGSDSINRVLEGLGATVETGMGETSGSAYMSTLTESLGTVLPIFADVLREPAFAEEKVNLAKKQQKSAISRRNDSPRQIAFREFDKILYGEDSPYARHPEYFTIDSISRGDVVSFHDRYVRPGNVILSVWGDFQAGEMKARIREEFGDWEAAGDASRPMPPQPDAEREYSVNFVQKDDVTQSTVLLGHPGELRRDDADYPPVIMMNEVLSGGFTGRLFQNVRKEKGLAYSVFGNYSAGYNRPGRFFAGVFSKSASTVEATDAVRHEIERMREAPPTAEELQLAKDSYLNSFVFNFDTKREVLSRLMTYEYYGYPSDFLQRTKDRIEEVTADDVLRVSKEYLHPDETHVLVVGKREEFSQDLSALTRGNGVREVDISIPTSPPGDEAEPAEASEESLAAGRKLLREARRALGGKAFADLENIRIEGETSRETAQGTVTLASTTTLTADGKVLVEQTLPNGMTVTIADDGEQMTLGTPQGTRAAPARMRKQFAGEVWRSLAFMMANLDHPDLSAESLGTKTVEGTTYEAVRLTPPEGESYTLYLDPETGRPARMEYTSSTQQGPVQATDVFGDYRTVDGVAIPHETITYQDGEKAAETRYTSVAVNVDLEQGHFTLEGGGGGS